MTFSSSTYSTDSNWLNKELFGINFWDKRLNHRFLEVAQFFARNPNSILKQVIEDRNNLKAAYRLFDNPKITPKLILEPHVIATKQRISEEGKVLAIMDTTDIAFTSQTEREGMGPLGGFSQFIQGFQLHSAYVVSMSGQPLGFLSAETLVREKKETPGNRKIPAKNRESFKWITGLKEIVDNTPEGSTCVILADRESDFYDFLNESTKLDARFCIRARWNRKLESDDLKLFDYLNTLPIASEKVIDVSRKNTVTKKIEKVRSKVQITYSKIEISPPEKPTTPDGYKHKPVICWAVQIKESEPLENFEALGWVLLTNVEVLNLKDAEEKIEWYEKRPKVEEFHKILKSGCHIEECQLQTKERVERLLAILIIIAWRIGWLTSINRIIPEEKCDLILSETEWKTLYCLRYKTKTPPTKPYTIKEAVLMLAGLGGYLNRKTDPPPGVVVMWRGWKKLSVAIEMWEIMQNE